MATEIRVHRSGQIGGCVTEIVSGRTRILVDYGEELPGSPNETAFHFNWEASPVSAVLFTHYHGDHIGRFAEIPGSIPLYMSALAREVLLNIHTTLRDAARRRLRWQADERTREWLVREQRILDILNNQNRVRLFEPDEGRRMKPVGIGPIRQGGPGRQHEITVTPCRVDHSAAEACMFLIETPDKAILHTGDFRGHGFGAVPEGAAVLEDVAWLAKTAKRKKIDTLIIEGTMMSRQEEATWSEDELLGAARVLFARHRRVFLIVSSTNLDSIRSFYTAAAAQGIPFYGGSEYIAGQLRTLGRYAGLPGLERVGAADPGNAEQMARMRRGGFVVMIKGSMKSSGRLLKALEGCRPVIVYSMWMGYLTRGLDKELGKFMQYCQARGLTVIPPPDAPFRPPMHTSDHAGQEPEGSALRQWPPMHTSGHASPRLLARVIKAADPGEIWPIHTENAAGFLQLELDPRLKERIRLGGYHKEKDHRALGRLLQKKFVPGGPALEKFMPAFEKDAPSGALHGFVQLAKQGLDPEDPEGPAGPRRGLAFCFRGNSGNEAVIYYKNHAAFIISSGGHVRFNFDHARYLAPEEWPRARKALEGFGFSFSGKQETQPKDGSESIGLVSMPPEAAARLSREPERLQQLAGRIARMIDSFSAHKGLIEKDLQQTLFLACKAQKNGYFFYDMEFAQPWGKLLGCKNQPDMLAVRFGPGGEPERLVFVEVKSTPEALKGGSGLANHIRGMENYPDWLMPVRGLDACLILEQYIALGMAEGPAGRYEAERERFRTLPGEVLLIFTGKDTLAQLRKMIKADPALLQGYHKLAPEKAGPFAAALEPEPLELWRKEL